MLKNWKRCCLVLITICILSPLGVLSASEKNTITHVVIVWLKQPGNEQVKQQFLKESRKLNDLPGVIYRHSGQVVASERGIVDDTFDVAVTVTLKDKQALKDYLAHPKHKEVLKKIKPLVNRIVAYDFINR